METVPLIDEIKVISALADEIQMGYVGEATPSASNTVTICPGSALFDRSTNVGLPFSNTDLSIFITEVLSFTVNRFEPGILSTVVTLFYEPSRR
jgi:hypothetical protein